MYIPFEFVVCPRREGGAFDDLAHLLPTEAKVVDGPHVGELHYFDLKHEHTEKHSHVCTFFLLLLLF